MSYRAKHLDYKRHELSDKLTRLRNKMDSERTFIDSKLTWKQYNAIPFNSTYDSWIGSVKSVTNSKSILYALLQFENAWKEYEVIRRRLEMIIEYQLRDAI